MVALHIVLWNDAVILDALFSQKVCGVGLLQKRIADILFIAENLVDGAGMPFCFSSAGQDAVRFQACSNFIHAGAFQILSVNAPDDLSLIRINERKNVVIGLDLNREGFTAHVMNLCGHVLKEYTEDITYEGKEELLRKILAFTRKAVDAYREKNIRSIGIAMQGVLDVEKGISVKFPHCPDWKDVPIKEIMEREFGKDVFVEHDPNCMLYRKLRDEESENMLLFRLDRSIGMAASVNGEILRGNGLLEVAHCIVVPDGKRCKCGKKGCIEAYLAPSLSSEGKNDQSLKELLGPLAVLLYNMVKVFHSDTVIVTGKLVKYREAFEKGLLAGFYQYCERDEVDIKLAEENGLAVEGAALIAVQGAIDRLRI